MCDQILMLFFGYVMMHLRQISARDRVEGSFGGPGGEFQFEGFYSISNGVGSSLRCFLAGMNRSVTIPFSEEKPSLCMSRQSPYDSSSISPQLCISFAADPRSRISPRSALVKRDSGLAGRRFVWWALSILLGVQGDCTCSMSELWQFALSFQIENYRRIKGKLELQQWIWQQNQTEPSQGSQKQVAAGSGSRIAGLCQKNCYHYRFLLLNAIIPATTYRQNLQSYYQFYKSPCLKVLGTVFVQATFRGCYEALLLQMYKQCCGSYTYAKIYILIMSWQVYLQNFVVLLGASCFSYSFFLRKKQQYFLQLFNTLEKCPKYHLDYVESISHLPSNKKIILFGTACSNDAQSVIARTYIKKSVAEDRLWNYRFKNPFKLETASKEYVAVQPADEDSILAFNLPKGPGEDAKHEQRVIIHKEPVCAFGMIQKSGESGRRLLPQILMGSKHEKILQYLDGEIVRINNRSRVGIVAGSMLIGLHFSYKMMKKRQKKEGVLKELEKAEKRD